MARNLKPRCKQCRRIGESICGSAKCALIRRNYAPGQHGLKRKPRLTEFGLQLREKQKAKIIYGILERQFRNYYRAASKQVGNTSEQLMQFLEGRLDNVVYRAGLAATRRQARQLVSHAHLLVNGVRCNIPSRQIKVGDIVTIRTQSSASKYFTDLANTIKMHQAPAWLEVDKTKYSIIVQNLPTAADAEQNIAVNLIVEYYSR
ncbi:MAG: 30S ribosomal protein S4 [Candidatus Kerfeldbacteria bacterium]|nr:30S ribosomal protein S4 [Candidatus Kerfeldbacteria bacterium]